MNKSVPYRVVPLPYRDSDSRRLRRYVSALWGTLLTGWGPLLLTIGIILARVPVLGSMRPFAISYLAAMTAVKPPAGWLGFAGTIAGLGLFGGPWLAGQALAGILLGRIIGRRVKIDRMWLFLALWLLVGGVRATVMGNDVLAVIVESVLSILLLIILKPAFKALPVENSRTQGDIWVSWSYDELFGLGLMVTALTLGLNVTYGQISVYDLLARYFVMLIALVGGAGYGALTGVMFGVVGTVSGVYEGAIVPFYVVGGAMGGLLHDHGKLGVIIGFTGGLFALAWQSPIPVLGAQLFLSIPAAVSLAFTPSLVHSFFGRFLPDVIKGSRSEQQEQRLEAVMAGRMREFAGIFDRLADSFRPTPVKDNKDEKMEKMLQAVCAQTCQPCPGFRGCWQDRFYDTYWEFINLLSHGQTVDGEVDLPASLTNRCPNSHKLFVSVNHILDILRLDKQWAERLTESKELVSGQLRGVADVMTSLAKRIAIDADYETDIEARLWNLLRRHNISVVSVSCLDLKTSREVTIAFPRPWEKRLVDEMISPLLSQFCRTNYSVWVSGEEGRRYTFLPERTFTLEITARKQAKQAGCVSGDNFTRVDLPNGKVAIVLSDGMGHGTQAALESSTTLSTLEELLKAGFDKQFAIKTVNSILMLRTPEDTFATVDMAIIDLFTGETEFVKIGSSPSFIKRGRSVEVIRSNSLPIGILNNIETDTKWRLLRHGDLLLMVTDGVSGSKKDDVGDWVSKVARQVESNDPGEVSDFILTKAREATEGKLVDDLTVIGVRLLARASAEAAGTEDSWVPAYAREATS